MAKAPNLSLGEQVEIPASIKHRAVEALQKLSSDKRRKFCLYYTQSEEHFANGVRSYAKAYNIKLGPLGAYETCKVGASRLLTDDNILRAVNALLDLGGLNDSFVDKQLAFLITQNADFRTKLGGIKEYNALKGRIIRKLEHQGVVLMGDLIRGFEKPRKAESRVIEPDKIEEPKVEPIETKPTQSDTGGPVTESILQKHGL